MGRQRDQDRREDRGPEAAPAPAAASPPFAAAFAPTGSVRLTMVVIDVSADAEQTTVEYKASAVSTDGQVRSWQGGVRIDWSRLPVGTNRDIEDAGKAALRDLTGYEWRVGDAASLFGGRTS